MTAQFSDTVRYRGDDYSIAGIDGEGLFNPARYGMEPVSWCTACWRGYLTRYEVQDRELRLQTLDICLTAPSFGGTREVQKIQAPEIEGRTPRDTSGEKFRLFEYRYENMQLRVPFTGGLLVAAGFIEELYVHMGFHPAWKYRTVHELLFENGGLIEERDVSEKLAEFRSEMRQAPSGPNADAGLAEVMKWVERCFSRSYRL